MKGFYILIKREELIFAQNSQEAHLENFKILPLIFNICK